MTPTLFTPIQVGHMRLSHRIVLAPLTRFRAYPTHTPGPHAATYYAQRASLPGTFLISEATFVSQAAGGRDFVPGIYTQEHVEGWKRVTDAVHEKGSFIFCQLWAPGRAAFPEVLARENNSPFVSASSIPLSTRPTAVPHALTEPEIKSYIASFATGARNAIAAGFDGVEIHGANGYLVDQFLQEVSNTREDGWGGSIEKRARFALEVVDALVKEVGAEKVSIRLSPWSPFQDMGLPDPKPQFSYLVNELRKYDLAYLHVTEPRVGGTIDVIALPQSSNNFLREIWCKEGENRVLISAGGYTRQTAIETAQEHGDMIAFGRLYIPNPDLPARLIHDLPLAKPDRATFYLDGDVTEKGYTDFPVADVQAEAMNGFLPPT
ncbi:NADH:flavin oxidoreductase/NADH oxidase [Suillus fuscotomentosus]|uniref:NADH:flavin oxidoreductase/NADH oxidase n=1 Tax=Suillus fuscotomentosus TaxID=1912939 RepID=A0AAD4DUN9_9AGAM|nr:NADH:flavin oxidoreductase/NADH oxidase [Suillus fuscotomentosus]KAG1894197.1 NADH:flavin oxidoreductase/NADH oxidase [Suillus fuscotomentosus]